MKALSLSVLASLTAVSLLSSCSRPTAYFQRTPAVSYATPAPAAAPVATPAVVTEQPAVAAALPAPASETSPTVAVQAKAALDQIDALASTKAGLTQNKRTEKRLNRVRTMLASMTAPSATAAPATPKKASLLERMMLKKMDKKISRQLAPANPEKTMISTGTLTLGAVLVIVGLLLVLLTTGAGATIGIIALLAGAVVLLLGLL
ncbi:hypothetical protein GCM10027578_02760 [Spirosoma luteolum]